MTSIERLEIGQTIWMRYGNYDRTSKITTTTVKKILPLANRIVTECGVILSDKGVEVVQYLPTHQWWSLVLEQEASRLKV